MAEEIPFQAQGIVETWRGEILVDGTAFTADEGEPIQLNFKGLVNISRLPEKAPDPRKPLMLDFVANGTATLTAGSSSGPRRYRVKGHGVTRGGYVLPFTFDLPAKEGRPLRRTAAPLADVASQTADSLANYRTKGTQTEDSPKKKKTRKSLSQELDHVFHDDTTDIFVTGAEEEQKTATWRRSQIKPRTSTPRPQPDRARIPPLYSTPHRPVRLTDIQPRRLLAKSSPRSRSKSDSRRDSGMSDVTIHSQRSSDESNSGKGEEAAIQDKVVSDESYVSAEEDLSEGERARRETEADESGGGPLRIHSLLPPPSDDEFEAEDKEDASTARTESEESEVSISRDDLIAEGLREDPDKTNDVVLSEASTVSEEEDSWVDEEEEEEDEEEDADGVANRVLLPRDPLHKRLQDETGLRVERAGRETLATLLEDLTMGVLRQAVAGARNGNVEAGDIERALRGHPHLGPLLRNVVFPH